MGKELKEGRNKLGAELKGERGLRDETRKVVTGRAYGALCACRTLYSDCPGLRQSRKASRWRQGHPFGTWKASRILPAKDGKKVNTIWWLESLPLELDPS